MTQNSSQHARAGADTGHQVQRDDREAGRPNTRAIRPLPKQAQFKPTGKRGERYLVDPVRASVKSKESWQHFQTKMSVSWVIDVAI